MSPRDQRIAIEAVLGFTDEIEPGIGNGWYRRNPTTGQTRRIPEYLTDLNVMRDAEHWLEYNATQWHGDENATSAPEAYMSHLKDIVGDDDWLFMGASAAQRAKAFLLTLNLWTNS